MDTEDRLASLERRLEKVEAFANWAEEKLTRIIGSPQAQKVMKLLGVDLK